MAPAALLMVAGLDEDTVDFVPNYDDSLTQPERAAGRLPEPARQRRQSGIAVGMATNMAPHNLVEVIGAARHLIAHPDCSLDDLMKFVPGPDLPGGGRIVGLDGIRDAYLTGRGSFRTRATARVEKLTPRRKGIVVTELPYLDRPREGHRAGQGPRAVQEAAGHRRRQGPHRPHARPAPGHRGQERLQPRRRARAALQAHPDGGLLRHQQRRPRRRPAAHPGPEGAAAHLRRLPHRGRAAAHRVPAAQARGPAAPRRGPARRDPRHRRGHPADPRLRRHGDGAGPADRRSSTCPTSRPTTSSSCSCAGSPGSRASSSRPSATSCERQIEELEAILADEKLLHRTVSTELADVAKAHGTPRRTVLLESAGTPGHSRRHARSRSPTTPAGCCSRRPACSPAPPPPTPLPSEGGRAKHDVVVGAVRTTARGEFALVTSPRAGWSGCRRSSCRPCRRLGGAPSLSGGAPLAVYVDLPARRGAADDRAARRRRPGPRARHRPGRRQAGHHRLPRAGATGRLDRPQGRRPRRRAAAVAARRRRGPRLRHQRRPAAALPGRRRCARRVARPVAWPASGSPRGHR